MKLHNDKHVDIIVALPLLNLPVVVDKGMYGLVNKPVRPLMVIIETLDTHFRELLLARSVHGF